MYIGGASRGCTQANLTADWVTQTIAQGWTLIPTYVGLQAPCSPSRFTNRIDPAQAAAQGVAAADDAIAQLNALGLGIGNPVYFDMEAFAYTDAACLAATRTFLDQWTVRLHARGYVSGLYSSSNTLGAGRSTAASRRRPATSRTTSGSPAGTPARRPPATRRSRTSTGPTTSGSTSTRAATRRPGAASRSTSTTTRSTPRSPRRSWPPRAPSSRSPVAVSCTGSPVARRSFVSTWESVGGGPQPVQTLSQTQFDSLPDRPADGTFLQSGSDRPDLAGGQGRRDLRAVLGAVRRPAAEHRGRPGRAGQRGHRRRLEPAHQRHGRHRGRPGPTIAGSTAAKTRFSWFGGYSSSAVATYDVRWRKARWDGTFGPWTRPASWQRTAVTDVPLGMRAGYAYCVVGARPQPGRPALRLDRRAAARPAPWTTAALAPSVGLEAARGVSLLRRLRPLDHPQGRNPRPHRRPGEAGGGRGHDLRHLRRARRPRRRQAVGRVNLKATSRHRKQLIMLPRSRGRRPP